MEYQQSYLDHDGQRLGLHSYPEPETPEGAPDAPVVVIWPAMGVPARYYRPFATELRAQGLAVVVADLRGTGTSTPVPSRRSSYGYAELAGDVGAVLAELKPKLAGRTVLLLGHSLGGQACALQLGLDPAAPVDGLVLVAVGLPWYRAYAGRRRYGVLMLTQGIAGASSVLRVWPGWRFGGRQARNVMRDWAYTARHGRFPTLAGTDVEAALSRVGTPVLGLSIEGDSLTPVATMDRLCAKLSAAPIERDQVTRAEFGSPVTHFTWVRASGPIAARIAAFARRR